MTETIHVPVLLHESIDGLNIKKGDVVIDATFGGGGHSGEILNRFKDNIRLIAFDRDEGAVKQGKEKFPVLEIEHANYTEISNILEKKEITHINAALFDLGTSVDQLKSSGRGFTFEKDEPLEMTMGKNDFNAKDIVNLWSQESLETIIRSYGEERFAKRISHAIVEYRDKKTIETTHELVEIIKKATPTFYHFKKIHPATRTFQALRIAVNDEIEGIKKGLEGVFSILASGGRIAVISFHSLEDREVKRYFRLLEDEGVAVRITKKPIIPSEKEIQENKKSRSAKLRIIEKK